MTHALARTNPKGESFVGRCIKCGEEGLTIEYVMLDCPMDDEISDTEALLEVLKNDD